MAFLRRNLGKKPSQCFSKTRTTVSTGGAGGATEADGGATHASSNLETIVASGILIPSLRCVPLRSVAFHRRVLDRRGSNLLDCFQSNSVRFGKLHSNLDRCQDIVTHFQYARDIYLGTQPPASVQIRVFKLAFQRFLNHEAFQ